MDTVPDLATFDIFRTDPRGPDLGRIETALRRSEAIAAGLTAKFPAKEAFAGSRDGARRGLALMKGCARPATSATRTGGRPLRQTSCSFSPPRVGARNRPPGAARPAPSPPVG